MNLKELQHTAEEEAMAEAPAEAPAVREDVQFEPFEVSFSDGDPIFRYICGTAGTGKTFGVKELAKEDPRVVLTATTGIAAVNLGGATINSMLRYYDTDSLVELSTRLDDRFRKWARDRITHWVLDEASMLAGEQLRMLVLAIETVNEELREAKTYHGPPVRLTLVGDFAQLPPVKARFAFEVDEWDRFEKNTTRLETIRRQSDADFIEALNHARSGNGHKALEYFRQFIVPNRDLDFSGTTILAKNAQVDRHNAVKLSEVTGEPATYKKRIWGKQAPEWRKHVPDALKLKIGARVMVLANQKRDRDSFPSQNSYLYVNGDIGTLVEHDTEGVRYRSGQPPQPVPAADVKLDRTGEIVSVGEVQRDYEDLDGKGRKCVTGGIEYLPLRVAYATTVHKSQGLTLDNVQVSFMDHFFTSAGMLYVALSRVRTPAGLRLVGNPDLFFSRCTTDARVRRWL